MGTEQLAICPCCNARYFSGKVVVDLNSNTICFNDKMQHASPVIAEIIFILAREMPNVVPYKSLTKEVYGSSRDCLLSKNSIKVQISYARKIGDMLGFQIKNMSKIGYRLVPAPRLVPEDIDGLQS